MDEFNLASRFSSEEDERPVRGRGKIRRLRKRGVGLEKPEDVEVPEDEEDMDLPEGEDMPDLPIGGPEEEPLDEDIEEDANFLDLLDRMEGGSASAGRADARRRKLKGRRPAPRFGDEDE